MSQEGAPSEGNKDKALFNAIKENSLEKVQALLKQGANPNAKGTFATSPLSIAVIKDSAAIAEAIIDAGGEVKYAIDNKCDDPLLIHAARVIMIKRSFCILKRLLLKNSSWF